MYKMYNTQLDEQSDDDKNSLSSSFWSDGEKQEDEEEEVEVERVIDKEDSRPVAKAEDSLQEASEAEKPELTDQGDFDRKSLEDESDDDDDDDEESYSSRSGSPAPSLMTSGYGTYRPEEQEGGGFRDNRSMTEFDQDSRGDLSEMKDDEEDDRSVCSFSGFDVESTGEPHSNKTGPIGLLTGSEPEANMAQCGDDSQYKEDVSPEDRSRADELHRESEGKLLHVSVAKDESNMKHVDNGSDPEEGRRHEEVQQALKEQNHVESEDPDEASSNKDIKFIDSKVAFSWMKYKQMCEEWEGNLREKKGKQFPPATTRNTPSLKLKIE